MQIEVITCDRCREEIKHPISLQAKSIGLNRDLCPDCIDSLKFFLSNRPDPNVTTIYEVSERELQDVYRKGADALEAWASGATADQLAEAIRDMLSRAKREADTPTSLLGVAV